MVVAASVALDMPEGVAVAAWLTCKAIHLPGCLATSMHAVATVVPD